MKGPFVKIGRIRLFGVELLKEASAFFLSIVTIKRSFVGGFLSGKNLRISYLKR